jgi:ADP-heptose:LPS heptosyltransferase
MATGSRDRGPPKASRRTKLNRTPDSTVRPGFSDFVPLESPLFSFTVRYNPNVQKLVTALKKAGIESLLDPPRFLALTVLIRHAAERSNGDFIELGVYKGGSAALTALVLRGVGLTRPLHLCDTFEGMPKTLDWEFHKEFDFADTSLEAVSARLAKLDPEFPLRFHRGLFSETLPGLADRRFCFAHVDADLYESVRQACEFVYPRMEKGGFIVFDDYGASTCPGAKKAVDEFFSGKLEKPTHVSMTAYGICVGQERTDFHKLLLRRTTVPALLRAAYAAPLRAIRWKTLGLTRRIGSPKIISMLAGPFLYGSAKAAPVEIGVKQARSILVLRPDTMGDLVLMSPFLRELRLSNPQAHVTLLVGPRFASLVELCPHVNQVLAYEPRVGEHLGLVSMHLRTLRFARKQLWPRRFDIALVPRWDNDLFFSNHTAYFSRARCRVAYSEHVSSLKDRLNRGFDQLCTRVVDKRAAKHEVERNLDFLRAVGGTVQNDRLELWLSEEDRQAARAGLTLRGVSSADVLIGVAPGAAFPKRVWPLGRFITLGRLLVKEFGVRIIVVGGPGDQERGQRLAEELGPMAVSFAGKLTLRQTAALLEHTPIVIANDSGPMHLAAAAGAEVVEISCHPVGGDPNHAHSPVRFHPWAREYVVVQPREASPPCTGGCECDAEAHCILGVSVDEVWEAAKALRSRTPRRSPQPRWAD